MLLALIIMYSLGSPVQANEYSGKKVNVVVLFKKEVDFDLLTSVNGEVIHYYKTINGVSVNIPLQSIELLKASLNVKSVQLDRTFNIEAQRVEWGLMQTKADISIQTGITGKGVKIAVLDTGIDTSHPDLEIAGGVCLSPNSFYEPCYSYNDDNGHGTHVAGIIAAKNNDIGIIGVAPESEIYAVKVLDDQGEGTSSSILAGIDWAINNNMDIINLSLTTPDYDPAMEEFLKIAYSKGILLVASAGNAGNSLGNEETILYPAKFESVIAVGAVNSINNRISSSATGDALEIVGPGENIYSTIPLSLDEDNNRDGYGYMTGTSMATPYITGILAGYIEKYPSRSHEELRLLLSELAIDLGKENKDSWYGYGLAQSDVTTEEVEHRMVVELRSNEDGLVHFDIHSLIEDFPAYNVYRNDQLIKENVTSLTFNDYVTKGIYDYTFVPVSHDGVESLLVNSHIIEVVSPYIKDLTIDDWFAPHVIYLMNESILTGFEDQTIRPNAKVTRAQAITMIGRAIELDGTKRATIFSDVSPVSFASGYIASAYKSGIIKGFTDGTLRPNQPVTRAEMAIMISNAYKLVEKGSLVFSDITSNVTGHEAIQKIATMGITKGYLDGTFKPYQHMTRSEFSVFIARAENEYFR